jgi:hypothetical protein
MAASLTTALAVLRGLTANGFDFVEAVRSGPLSDIEDPGPNFSGSGPVEYRPAEAVHSGVLERLLASEEARLLAVPGGTFVGICLGSPGVEAMALGVVHAGVAARLPRVINGVAGVVTVTGPVDTLR